MNGTQQPKFSLVQGEQEYMGSFSMAATKGMLVSFYFLAVIVTVSNLLVIICFVVWRPLRSAYNAITVSLAVTDMIVGSIMTPWAIVAHSLTTSDFITCFAFIFSDMCVVSGSLLHILALTVERYLAISCPFWYQAHVTRWKVMSVIVCIWVLSFATGFLAIINVKYDPVTCWVNVHMVYHALRYSVPFVTLTLAIVILYVKIMLVVRRHINSINDVSITQNSEGYSPNASNRKMLKTIGLVLGVFLISWLPFHILHVVNLFISNDILLGLEFCSYILTTGNSAMNPIIYFFYNRTYREAFLSIVPARIRHRCKSCQRN